MSGLIFNLFLVLSDPGTEEVHALLRHGQSDHVLRVPVIREIWQVLGWGNRESVANRTDFSDWSERAHLSGTTHWAGVSHLLRWAVDFGLVLGLTLVLGKLRWAFHVC